MEPWDDEECISAPSREFLDFCKERYSDFLNEYREQIVERAKFSSWLEYNNFGFDYKYLPSVEIEKAVQAIYDNREILEKNNYWDEAKAITNKLSELVRSLS